MTKKAREYHQTHSKWTREQLGMLKEMWNENTIEEIATAVGKKKKQVVQMAYNIRQNYPLALRSKREGYEALIDEVFA